YENPRDPWESMNRSTFSFNENVDELVLKPVAKGYEQIPSPIRTGVGNFFGNVADVWIGANNLLQGKPTHAVSDIGRVLINSTVGVLGLFDVASDMGLEKHEEDFGQTLGKWGVSPGPYLVVPLFGPKTLRDAAGTVVDFKADLINQVDPISTKNTLYGTRVIQDRSTLLPMEKAIEDASLDKYSYIRDAYLQRRAYLIRDGETAPKEEIDDEYRNAESLKISDIPEKNNEDQIIEKKLEDQNP
ncbi:MAG TPA: VacJ family lipoprotein, partial [Ignavibacteriaceae bacterium]